MKQIKHRSLQDRRARRAAAIEPLERRMLLTAVVVNTTADSVDTQPSTVVSLRDAINVANKSTSATTITFSPTVFAKAQTIILSGSDLEISATKPVTITGPAAGVTINGNQKSNDFQIAKGATAAISGMTITGGNITETVGGGIENNGALTLNDVSVTGNSGADGGINNTGTLVISNSTVSNSSVANDFGGDQIGNGGGGIENDTGATMTLTNVTVSDNHAADAFGNGGGINNDGTATLIDCTVSGNVADFYGSGGGINNNGSMTLTDCTVSNNGYAGGQGGADGGISSSGPITLTGCTISGNIGGGHSNGGGLGTSNVTTLTDCTISGNTDFGDPNGGGAPGAGGGIYSSGIVTLTDCTISGNSAASAGGIGSPTGGDKFTLANTIVAGNTSVDDPDAGGAFNSLGYNLIGNVGDSTGWKTTDLTGTTAKPLNAKLGPLANHGGPTLTLLPLVGSPAIDHGSNALIPKGITTDQRGLARIVNGTVDIGAVEVQDTSIITGTVFYDANGNGLRDADEGGLAGFTVYLDLKNDARTDPGDPFTITNAAGQYSIGRLAPGNYTVRILTKTGDKQTAPPLAIPTMVGSEQTVTGPALGEVRIGTFAGKPAPFGLVQAENFDLGGQGTGYFNPDNTNRGGLYRPAEGVGIGAIPSSQGGGYFVGYTVPGESLNYTVSVAATASYTLEFRVASKGQGGTFHLNVDGKNLTDELSVPSTGSYDVYTTVSEPGVTLAAGIHVLQLVIDSDVATIGAAGNFDWIQGVKTGPPNLLVNGNFAQGATGFSSKYPNSGTSGGGYLVGPNPSAVFDGTWVDIGDHTTGHGLMLLADASTTPNQYVWQETVNVTAATTYAFAGWAADMHKLDTNVPDLAIYVNNVQIGTTFAVPSNPGGIWSSFGATWKSGTSKTATVKIVDLDTQFAGNDFALDDLSFDV